MSTTVATFGVPGDAEWADLSRRATPNVFLHPAALAAAANAGLAPLQVLQAWHGDRPRRLVGLWAVQQSRTTPLGPNCLATPPYEYAFLSNPVIDPDFMHEAVDAFLDLIASDARLPSVLRLRYLDADCPSYLALLGALAARGAWWMEVSRRARPFATRTSGRKLQGATHGKLRQKWNRLCAAGPVEVRNDSAPEAVREAFETYLMLEGASWKGERGTAMLSNPDLARFARHLIAGLARDGSASVALLMLGDRAIAAQVVLRCVGRAYTWKTAFDAAYGEFSPGALLVDKLTEQLFATDGIQAIESCSPEGGFMGRMWTGRRSTVDLAADLGSATSLQFSAAALGARSYAQLRAVRDALRDPSSASIPRWSGGAVGASERGRAAAVTTTGAASAGAAGGVTVAVARHADTVVCSPHFDDAVLCCWSVLDRDKDCAVVNVFTGAPDAGFTSWIDQLNGASTSALHMCQRELEDRKALSVAGKAPIDLGMLEVQYRLRQSPALHALLRHMRLLRFVLLRLPALRPALYSVSAPSPEKLADAIMQAAPGAANVCAPAGIGGHADHLLVRQAAAVLASRGLNVRLYADMPYAVRYGWPRWIGTEGPRGMDRATAFWVRHLKAMRLGDPMGMATVVRLTPEERARKASAIRQYATQIGALSAGRMRGWLQDTALAYEVYWQLRPATGEQPQRAFLGDRRLAGSTGAMPLGAWSRIFRR